MRVKRGEYGAPLEWQGKWEMPEKTSRSAASSSMIPTSKNLREIRNEWRYRNPDKPTPMLEGYSTSHLRKIADHSVFHYIRKSESTPRQIRWAHWPRRSTEKTASSLQLEEGLSTTASADRKDDSTPEVARFGFEEDGPGLTPAKVVPKPHVVPSPANYVPTRRPARPLRIAPISPVRSPTPHQHNRLNPIRLSYTPGQMASRLLAILVVRKIEHPGRETILIHLTLSSSLTETLFNEKDGHRDKKHKLDIKTEFGKMKKQKLGNLVTILDKIPKRDEKKLAKIKKKKKLKRNVKQEAIITKPKKNKREKGKTSSDTKVENKIKKEKRKNVNVRSRKKRVGVKHYNAPGNVPGEIVVEETYSALETTTNEGISDEHPDGEEATVVDMDTTSSPVVVKREHGNSLTHHMMQDCKENTNAQADNFNEEFTSVLSCFRKDQKNSEVILEICKMTIDDKTFPLTQDKLSSVTKAKRPKVVAVKSATKSKRCRAVIAKSDRSASEAEKLKREIVTDESAPFELHGLPSHECIATMRHPSEVCVQGKVKITVLKGMVEVLGFTLTAENSENGLCVFCPQRCMPLSITSRKLPEDAQNTSYIKKLEALKGSYAKLLNRCHASDCVLLLLPDTSSILTKFLNIHFPIRLFPKVWSNKGRKFHKEENRLQCQFTLPDNDVEMGSLTRKDEWEQAISDMSIFADGSKTGASQSHQNILASFLNISETLACERRSVMPVSFAAVGIHGIPRRGGGLEAASASFQEEGGRVVLGGKGVGKSTFLRYLANSCVSKHGSVLWLDFDPGQAEFTVPGCMSAVLVKEPLLGPNFTHISTPLRSKTVQLRQSGISRHFFLVIYSQIDPTDILTQWHYYSLLTIPGIIARDSACAAASPSQYKSKNTHLARARNRLSADHYIMALRGTTKMLMAWESGKKLNLKSWSPRSEALEFERATYLGMIDSGETWLVLLPLLLSLLRSRQTYRRRKNIQGIRTLCAIRELAKFLDPFNTAVVQEEREIRRVKPTVDEDALRTLEHCELAGHGLTLVGLSGHLVPFLVDTRSAKGQQETAEYFPNLVQDEFPFRDTLSGNELKLPVAWRDRSPPAPLPVLFEPPTKTDRDILPIIQPFFRMTSSASLSRPISGPGPVASASPSPVSQQVQQPPQVTNCSGIKVRVLPAKCKIVLAVLYSVTSRYATRPVLYTGRAPVLRMVYLGEIDVSRCPSRYNSCVEHIINYCSDQPDLQNIPWLINTMGFNRVLEKKCGHDVSLRHSCSVGEETDICKHTTNPMTGIERPTTCVHLESCTVTPAGLLRNNHTKACDLYCNCRRVLRYKGTRNKSVALQGYSEQECCVTRVLGSLSSGACEIKTKLRRLIGPATLICKTDSTQDCDWGLADHCSKEVCVMFLEPIHSYDGFVNWHSILQGITIYWGINYEHESIMYAVEVQRGLGVELAISIIRCLRPTNVIHIESKRQALNYAQTLTSSYVNEYMSMWSSGSAVCDLDYVTRILPSAVRDVPNRAAPCSHYGRSKGSAGTLKSGSGEPTLDLASQ
ncbi:hypothetical protein PR048_020548 [Dryococelus australis]|uniref:Polynucleotide 5'-hydroxyl-kinase NOL9 n=1 Tax=Dryococelus australis TaxID=614101 RepID=A0ABQ9H6P6_9NEOP|nr:hypothetical protein PR048_020548 [Dryococelus australis]